jgi:hypothetical protein
MAEPENDELEDIEPVLVDMNEDPVWVHGCETDEEGTVAIHLIVSEFRGRCDMGEDHYATVNHMYTGAQARQLAAALLNAADALDEQSPPSED